MRIIKKSGSNGAAFLTLMGHQAPYCGILYELGIGVWPSMVGRYVRDVEVVGSNPITPTTWYYKF